MIPTHEQTKIEGRTNTEIVEPQYTMTPICRISIQKTKQEDPRKHGSDTEDLSDAYLTYDTLMNPEDAQRTKQLRTYIKCIKQRNYRQGYEELRTRAINKAERDRMNDRDTPFGYITFNHHGAQVTDKHMSDMTNIKNSCFKMNY